MTNQIIMVTSPTDNVCTTQPLHAVDYAIHEHLHNHGQPMYTNHIVITDAKKIHGLGIKAITNYQNKPRRNFIYLHIQHDSVSEQHEFMQNFQLFHGDYGEPDYILYTDITTPLAQHLILRIDTELDKNQYEFMVTHLYKTLDVTITKTKLRKIASYAHIVPTPKYVTVEQYNGTRYSNQGKAFLIDVDAIGENAPSSMKTQKIKYSIEKLEQSLQQCLIQRLYDFANDEDIRLDFFKSVACAIIGDFIPVSFATTIIERIVEHEQGSPKMLQRFTAEYHTIYTQYTSRADLRMQSTPIGTYLPLYASDAPVINIAEQLLSHLDPNFMPDPKLELAQAANIIANVYPPYIIKQFGSDKENVVIFNPLTGVWTHDEDLFYSLLTAIRPLTTSHQLDTVMRTFAAQARNANRYIKPYNGSQYLLFQNCCVDINDYITYDIKSNFVRDLYFTERSKLSIDFVYNPETPIRKNGKIAGGDWTPKEFIEAYGENNPEKIQYFLFGLSLGLFGGHNFGVHFDIQGESRWGKTTISEIYNKLYDNRTITISFTSLNGRFPFTSYNKNTSIIWINECNIGTDPLNDEYGTVVYDGLADNQVRFQVKGGHDIVLNDPPQVYIDGTQLIQAKEINTGPAGRTLAYKLPPMTQQLRNQAYAVSIVEFLHSEDVLQWLVFQMMEAYREMIPEYRRNNLKLNLAIKDDLDLLPQIAQDWRKEFSNEASDLSTWFMDEIEEYLSIEPDDEEKQTLLHMRILYEMYAHAYRRQNPLDKQLIKIKTPDQFEKQMTSLLDHHGWRMHYVGSKSNSRSSSKRKRVSTIEQLNFNWTEYEKSYVRPKSLLTVDEAEKDTYLKGVFKTQISGWFVLQPTLNKVKEIQDMMARQQEHNEDDNEDNN